MTDRTRLQLGKAEIEDVSFVLVRCHEQYVTWMWQSVKKQKNYLHLVYNWLYSVKEAVLSYLQFLSKFRHFFSDIINENTDIDLHVAVGF